MGSVGGIFAASREITVRCDVQLRPRAVRVAARDVADVRGAFVRVDRGNVHAAIRTFAPVVHAVSSGIPFIHVLPRVWVHGEHWTGTCVIVPVAATHEEKSVVHADGRDGTRIELARRPARGVGVAERRHLRRQVWNVRGKPAGHGGEQYGNGSFSFVHFHFLCAHFDYA